MLGAVRVLAHVPDGGAAMSAGEGGRMTGQQQAEQSLFGRRIGNRILICPECAQRSVIVDAGPGRAFCRGRGTGFYEHPELEMVAFVREDGRPVTLPASGIDRCPS